MDCPNIQHRLRGLYPHANRRDLQSLQLEESAHLFERAQHAYQNLIIEVPRSFSKKAQPNAWPPRDLHRHFKRVESSLDCFQRALTLNEEILQEEPYLDHQRDLSILYLKVGDIHQEMNRANQAIESFQKALELQRELVELDPIPLHRRELYLTLSRIGEMYHAFHQYESSLASYHAAMEINQVDRRDGGGNQRHNKRSSNTKAGDVYRDGKRYEEDSSTITSPWRYADLIDEAPSSSHRGRQIFFSRIAPT